MKVLLIGSGGREHSIGSKIRSSHRLEELFFAPGNAGTSKIGTNIDIDSNDIDSLLSFALQKNIDLTIVGPEQPLVEGITNVFQSNNLKIFGPSSEASQLEGSKIWSYKIMEKYNVPTAKSKIFTDYNSAIKYLKTTSEGSLVVKADGLAAGKGVFLSENNSVLEESIKDLMIEKTLGDSGKSILLSERLSGFEASVFGLVSGENISDLIVACDYKRVFDNDKGPNTGGMGAYSTPEILNHELLSEIKENIFKPIASGLVNEQKPYYGILYAGLMITDEGPKVIEFNCRFGDPECQIIMSRIDSDLLDIFFAIANKEPANFNVNNFSSIGIVLASEGYPGKYKINFPIKGLDKISNSVSVFHSGTDFDTNGNYITNGGRVITLVATSDSLESSRLKCYENITNIEFENMYYRKDIGKVLRSCDK